MSYRKYNSKISEQANVSLEKRAKTVHRQKFMIAWILILTVCLYILISSGIHAIADSSYEPEDLQRYYMSIEVKPGDTLSSITQQYNSQLYQSNQDYLMELKDMNGLYNDQIISGTSLIVYYYSFNGPKSFS